MNIFWGVIFVILFLFLLFIILNGICYILDLVKKGQQQTAIVYLLIVIALEQFIF